LVNSVGELSSFSESSVEERLDDLFAEEELLGCEDLCERECVRLDLQVDWNLYLRCISAADSLEQGEHLGVLDPIDVLELFQVEQSILDVALGDEAVQLGRCLQLECVRYH
jgi:hypothetical protein